MKKKDMQLIFTDKTLLDEGLMWEKELYLLLYQFGYLKIGVSKDPEQRARDLNRNSPINLIPVPLPLGVKRTKENTSYVHARLKIKGTVFRCERALADTLETYENIKLRKNREFFKMLRKDKTMAEYRKNAIDLFQFISTETVRILRKNTLVVKNREVSIGRKFGVKAPRIYKDSLRLSLIK